MQTRQRVTIDGRPALTFEERLRRGGCGGAHVADVQLQEKGRDLRRCPTQTDERGGGGQMAPIGRARAPCHGRQPGLPVVSTSSVAIPAAAGLPHLIDQQLAQPLVLPMSRDGQVDELAHEREVAGGARTAHEPLPPFKPAAAAPRGVHVHGHHHRAGVERARQLLLGEAPLGCHAPPTP